MKRIINIKTLVSAALIVFSCWWMSIAMQVKSGGTGDKNTWGTMMTIPKFALTLLIVSNVIILIMEIRKALKEEPEPMDPLEKKSLIISVFMMAVIFLYGFAIDYLGYIISNIILMVIGLWVFGERKWKVLVIVPVVVTLLLYVIFKHGLMVSLPSPWFM